MLKRMATTAIAAVAAAGLVTAGSAPATADTVTSHWVCSRPLGYSGAADFRITVTAPANATRGQTATLTASFYNTVPRGTHEAAGKFRAQLEIAVGGAGSGVVYANGLTNPDTPADEPLGLDGGHVDYTFTTAGTVTFKPQVIRFLDNAGNYSEICGNSATPIAATTHVS